MNPVEETVRAGLVKLALLPVRALKFVDVDKHSVLQAPARWVALYSAYFAVSARGEERFQQDVDKFVAGLPVLDHMVEHTERLTKEESDAYLAEVKPMLARARTEGWIEHIERVNVELDLVFARHVDSSVTDDDADD